MPKEIETKFKIKDVAAFKIKLQELGAKFVEQRFEADVYYSPAVQGLFNGTVRVRSLDKGGEFTIKYNSGGSDKTFKVRQELQVKVDDTKILADMIRTLGYTERFRKEKKRMLYSYEDAVIAIDILPYIGSYVEIEEEQTKIKKLSEKLGLDIKKAIPDTYMDLFSLYKVLHNVNDMDLVFPKNER